MRRRSVHVLVASVFVVGVASVLAVVSGGQAGNNPGTLDVFAQPQVITSSGNGFVGVKFTTGPSGGTATHVVVTIELSSALLNPTATSGDCSGPGTRRFGRHEPFHV